MLELVTWSCYLELVTWWRCWDLAGGAAPADQPRVFLDYFTVVDEKGTYI